MSSSTATVEVLTAEVRVLMVGSRQVTQSVFWQLDIVDRHVIEPFGRVRVKLTAADYGKPKLWVVGRDVDTGDLVRSYLGYTDNDLREEWTCLPLIVLAGLR